jgi:hypothetical protein
MRKRDEKWCFLHRLQGDRAIGLKCFSPLCLASLQRALAEVMMLLDVILLWINTHKHQFF